MMNLRNPMGDYERNQGGDYYVDTPEDAKTEFQLQSVFVDHYLEAREYHDEFFREAEIDEGMYEGDKNSHWGKDPVTKEYSWKIVEQAGKPALVKNKIFPIINLLAGIQSQEPIESRLIGRSSEDTIIADATSEIIKWMGSRGKLQRKFSDQFRRGITSGRGWLGIEQVDSEKNLLETSTLFTVLDTNEILYDPKSKEYDLSDADYLIRIKTVTRSEVRANWPDKEKELTAYFGFLDEQISRRNAPESRLQIMRRHVQIGEHWYRVYKKVHIVIDSMNGTVHFVDDIPEERIMDAAQMNPGLQVMTKYVRVMKLVRQCGLSVRGVFLDGGDSPYDDNFFPYLPYFAYRGRNHDFGVVRNLRDPQREINKRDSQMLHLINQMPRTKVITDDADLADKFEQGEDVVTAGKGAKWDIIPHPQLPVAHAHLVESNKNDIRDISGVNENLQGQKMASNEPGIVVSLRQKQGMTMVAMLFDNMQDTVELATHIMLSRMRQFMMPQQIARILGPKIIALAPELPTAILQKDVEEFDLEVIQVPSSPTVRAENFEKLEKLISLGIPVSPATVVEASDVPQKEQILAEMQGGMNTPPQALPAGPPSKGSTSGGAPSPAPSGTQPV
jgi:hypothetical protein